MCKEKKRHKSCITAQLPTPISRCMGVYNLNLIAQQEAINFRDSASVATVLAKFTLLNKEFQ